MAKQKHNDYGTGIPLHEVEALARVLLPEIQKFLRAKKDRRSSGSGRNNRRSNRNNVGRHPAWMPPLSLPPKGYLRQK